MTQPWTQLSSLDCNSGRWGKTLELHKGLPQTIHMASVDAKSISLFLDPFEISPRTFYSKIKAKLTCLFKGLDVSARSGHFCAAPGGPLAS